jgi:hypothetical protein
MAHGTPDWGITSAGVTVHRVEDLGEAVVRLGSPVSHDRRGDVIWWDDFECSLNKWQTQLDGTGAAAVVSTTRARNGENSVQLTAGSTAGRESTILRSLPFPVLSGLGFEVHVSLDGNYEQVIVHLLIDDGAEETIYEVRWTQTGGVLAYLNAAGTFTDFASGVSLSNAASHFHALKLVVDAQDQEYARFILNSTVYALAGIGARVFAAVANPGMQIAVQTFGDAGVNGIVYADDAIVTINEPL